MKGEQVLEVLRETGVMLEGHFLLTSGRHSDRYMQCAHLFEHPKHAVALTALLAKQFEAESVDLTVAPAVGGIILGYELAKQLGIRNIFAERQDGKMVLRRGFEIRPGERVVVTEDVITTGGTVKEVLELVREAGGIPVAVGSIVDRSSGKADFGVPFKAAIAMSIGSWESTECPLCAQGSTAVKPGSRGLK